VRPNPVTSSSHQRSLAISLALAWALLPLYAARGEEPRGQNPSPMVEHTRAHKRLKDESLKGRREKLRLGALFLPEGFTKDRPATLLIHFHGPGWIAERAVAGISQFACVSVSMGTGSSAYARPFAEAAAFGELLKEAEEKAGVSFQTIGLSGWSAGYGAIRAILRRSEDYERIGFVILADGLHAGYVGGKPGPKESALVEEDLDVFLRYARDAAAGKKRLLIAHSEVFPGTFASTTETADWLLRKLDVRRRPVLEWGPLGMQQLSEARKGNLAVIGYAGNSAPDHVDHLHALPVYLKEALGKGHGKK
jgi:hypothetical protein